MKTAQNKTGETAGGRRPCLRSPLVPVIFLFFLLLPSCRTAPPVSPMPREAVSIPLEPGGIIYMFIDVQHARPIMDSLSFRGMDTEDRNFRRILDSTSYALAAVYEAREGEPAGTRFRLVAHGVYPSGRARMAMRCSRHWRGQRSGATGDRYWHSPAAMLSMSITRNEAFLTTSLYGASVDPFYVGPGTNIPEGFNEFRRGAVVSLWLENPAAFINQRLMEMHIPLEIPAEQFFANVLPAPNAPSPSEPLYEVYLRIQVASPLQAMGLAFALSAARMFVSPAALGDPADGGNFAATLMSLLLANPAAADGRHLGIRTDPMTAGEISLLLGQFAF